MVLIWSFGLPFLPGARARSRPLERPALGVAVYRAGRPDFYLLQELEPDDVAMGPTSWQFGRTQIHLEEHSERRRLTASLDMPIPASDARLRGSVETSGPVPRLPRSLEGDPRHAWTPLFTASSGTAALTWGETPSDRYVATGRTYLDANASDTPLDALGIEDWWWGRVGLGERELIYYVVTPEDRSSEAVTMVLVVEPDGDARLFPAATLTSSKARRGVYGLSHPRELRVEADGLDVVVCTEAIVDDGPFYLRALIRATAADGAEGRGIAERVVPSRVDLRWQRPFVRMRSHRVGGDNSLWLPLFSGKRRGRLRRLVSQLWSQEGAA